MLPGAEFSSSLEDLAPDRLGRASIRKIDLGVDSLSILFNSIVLFNNLLGSRGWFLVHFYLPKSAQPEVAGSKPPYGRKSGSIPIF